MLEIVEDRLQLGDKWMYNWFNHSIHCSWNLNHRAGQKFWNYKIQNWYTRRKQEQQIWNTKHAEEKQEGGRKIESDYNAIKIPQNQVPGGKELHLLYFLIQ